MNSQVLKPCPFCSCTDVGEVTINQRLESRHRRFKVYCKVCQCRTSEHKTRKEARIYWNTRAAPAPIPDADHVEDVRAMVVPLQVELGFLEDWLRQAAEPIGQSCCGRLGSECCGNAEPDYMDMSMLLTDMDNRRKAIIRQLVAVSTTPGGGQ